VHIYELTLHCRLQRILEDTRCSPATLIVALIYLQRSKDTFQEGRAPRLTSHNIQRVLLTAVMLASKFLDEPAASNEQVAYSVRDAVVHVSNT
jgi:hypothetical protein